ncbi:MAG: PilZ domain-containing protein [Planctomycetota bacterium]|nr:PilZ domain-containing protein [Planctomycetota bacterium]
MNPEMLNLSLALGLLLLSLLLIVANRTLRRGWVVLRTGLQRKGPRKAFRPGNDDLALRDELLAQGVDGDEADLLLTLLASCDEPNMARLFNSHFAFEDALEKALSKDPELIRELRVRRALDRIRIRRGWEVSGEISQGLSLPIEDEELLIQGPDGLSLRTVMIHRDDQSLAVRVIESSVPSSDSCPWQVGVDLQVSFFRPESGCLLFETRLQEHRDLGDWFLFVETPQMVRIEQRRQAVRVPIEGEIRLLHLPLGDRNGTHSDRELMHVASLIDIGTGGLGFTTEAVVELDDLLIIRGIPSLGSIDVTARVVADLSGGETPEGGIGVRFVGMSATDRDRIASFVFSKRIEAEEIESQFDSAEHAFGSDGGSV